MIIHFVGGNETASSFCVLLSSCSENAMKYRDLEPHELMHM